MKIAILVFDRFTDLDVFLPWDLLNRVPAYSGLKDWEVKLVGTQSHHTSQHGLTIPMMADLSYLTTADAVIVESGPGVQKLLKDPDYIDQLRNLLDPSRQLIGSMCSGALLLAELGLLHGKTATTYRTRMKQLAAYEGVDVIDAPFVQHENVATAAQCLSALHLVRWIIERLVSPEVAEKVYLSVKENGA
ncbi:MAG: DJ-1/PfpI family protein [Tumebacillaceae bacterium]